MKPKNIKFSKQLIDRTKEYIESHKQIDPTFTFSKLVREALTFYLDFWYSDNAIDMIFKYIDEKIDTEEFEKFTHRVYLRIQEQMIKRGGIEITFPDVVDPSFRKEFKDMAEIQRLIHKKLSQE